MTKSVEVRVAAGRGSKCGNDCRSCERRAVCADFDIAGLLAAGLEDGGTPEDRAGHGVAR
jgi:hypothetical protein